MVDLENRVYRDLAGRVARLRQVNGSNFDATYILLLDFLDPWSLAYSFDLIRRAWLRAPLQDRFFHSGLTALAILRNKNVRGRSSQDTFLVPEGSTGHTSPTRLCTCGFPEGCALMPGHSLPSCITCCGILPPSLALIVKACRSPVVSAPCDVAVEPIPVPCSTSAFKFNPDAAVFVPKMGGGGKGYKSKGGSGSGSGHRHSSASSWGYHSGSGSSRSNRDRSPIRRHNSNRYTLSLHDILDGARQSYEDEQAKQMMLQMGTQLANNVGAQMQHNMATLLTGGGHPWPLVPPQMLPPPQQYLQQQPGPKHERTDQVRAAVDQLISDAASEAASEADKARVQGLASRLQAAGVSPQVAPPKMTPPHHVAPQTLPMAPLLLTQLSRTSWHKALSLYRCDKSSRPLDLKLKG